MTRGPSTSALDSAGLFLEFEEAVESGLIVNGTASEEPSPADGSSAIQLAGPVVEADIAARQYGLETAKLRQAMLELSAQ